MEKTKKRNLITVALCCLAIVIVLIILSFFVPIYGDVCGKSEYSGQKECTAHHIAVFTFLYVGGALEAHNGAIVAIATIFIAWFTYQLRAATIGLIKSTDRLWDAGEKQRDVSERAISISRQTGEAQVRAYLTIAKISIAFDGPAYVPNIVVTVKNSGQSPAIDLAFNYKAIVAKDGRFLQQVSEVTTKSYPISAQQAANSVDEYRLVLDDLAVCEDPTSAPSHILLNLEGLISYQTVFGVERNETEFDCIVTCVFVGPVDDLWKRFASGDKSRIEMQSVKFHKPEWMRKFKAVVGSANKGSGNRAEFHTISEMTVSSGNPNEESS